MPADIIYVINHNHKKNLSYKYNASDTPIIDYMEGLGEYNIEIFEELTSRFICDVPINSSLGETNSIKLQM